MWPNGRQYTEYPPWLYPPHSAFWFDYVEDGYIKQSNSPLSLVEFNLPTGSVGIIKWFGQEVCDTNKENLVTWRIRINDCVDNVYGYMKGVISTIKQPTETFIFLPIGCKVEFKVETLETDEIYVIGRLKGWHWLGEDVCP